MGDTGQSHATPPEGPLDTYWCEHHVNSFPERLPFVTQVLIDVIGVLATVATGDW